jgi:N-acetylmuramoyl-L-alanine amidase
MSRLLSIPQLWVERSEPGGAAWVREHAPGLCRAWANAPEQVDCLARAVGVSWKLLVTRMELEQSAISYAWDDSLHQYPGGDADKFRYLCGADKTDTGPREHGWFGPARQLLACALRFRFWYRGEDGSATGWENWLGLREDPRFAAGVPMTRTQKNEHGELVEYTFTPANQASADCLRYTTSMPAQQRLREIGLRWFPEDYENEEGVAEVAGKLIVLDAGHPPGGGAHGVGGDEAALNGEIRDALAPMLTAAGHRVVLSPRTNNVTRIGQESAALQPDVFLSIHQNAGGGTGIEVYTAGPAYSGGIPGARCCPKATLLAGLLAKEIMAELGVGSHGKVVKDDWNNGGHLGVLAGGNNWAGPGAVVLVEGPFVDAASEAAVLRDEDYPHRMASALFRGIQGYLGGSLATPEPTEPEQPPEVAGTAAEWRARVLADQEWLAAHGFDPGASDGVWGPRTAAAMNKAQQAF